MGLDRGELPASTFDLRMPQKATLTYDHSRRFTCSVKSTPSFQQHFGKRWFYAPVLTNLSIHMAARLCGSLGLLRAAIPPTCSMRRAVFGTDAHCISAAGICHHRNHQSPQTLTCGANLAQALDRVAYDRLRTTVGSLTYIRIAAHHREVVSVPCTVGSTFSR